MSSSAETPRRLDIDGLRGLAVFAILAFHAAPSLAPGGFVGVDVFFVISGYLITGIIESERRRGVFSFSRFYLRRARRILPAYIVVTGLVAATAYFFLMPRELKAFGRTLAASATFLTNHAFARGGGYFEPTADQAPLLHLWSLAVEEQFYLIWPVALVGLSIAALRRYRGAAILLLLGASLAGAQLMLASGQSLTAFYLAPFRAWEFLVGAVLALRIAPPVQGRKIGNLAASVGLLLLAFSVWGLSRATTFPGLAAVPACLGAGLLIWSGSSDASRPAAWLSSRPMVKLGTISYSLYLWHWPLLVFGRIYLGRPLQPLEGVAIALASLPLAWMTWRFVEQPWRRVRRPKLAHLALAAGSLAAVFALGRVATSTHGAPGRLPSSVRAAAEFEEKDVNPQRDVCMEGASDERTTPSACRPAGPVDVIVWGDSHADALFPGVALWAAHRGYSTQQSTMGGCPPLVGVRALLVPDREHADCAPFNASVLRDIEDARSLKLIVLIARWPLYEDLEPRYDINSPRVVIEDPTGRRGAPMPLDHALDRTLTAIARTGTPARVVIMGPVPELTFNPPLCIAQHRLLRRDERRCWSADAELPLSRTRIAEAKVARALAAHPGVATVNPSRTLCASDRCTVVMKDRLLYFDDDHLSASGARQLAPAWLDAALQR